MDSFERQATRLAILGDRCHPAATAGSGDSRFGLNPAQLGHHQFDETASKLISPGRRLTGDDAALLVVSPTRPVGHRGRLHRTQVGACGSNAGTVVSSTPYTAAAAETKSALKATALQQRYAPSQRQKGHHHGP